MVTSTKIKKYNKEKIASLNNKAKKIRRNIILMLAEAKSGHTGGSLGMADIMVSLYYEILKHNPKKPNSKDRDYFFLSNGHICPVLYAVLAEFNYFPPYELSNLRKINSLLQGHPHNTINGIENSGGPLGQGISMATGAALSLKLDKKDNKVFCVCGDGELNEGQAWEAAMFASKYKLDNFYLIVDYNNIQLDGPTKKIMDMLDLKEKFNSFGFDTFECNGNNINQFLTTVNRAIKKKNKPKVIIAKTIPGKGVSFMENDYHWHGKAPKGKEINLALEELQ